jgi:hypothetical protein
MRSLHPSLLKVLLLVIVASLVSSVIASAAPITDDSSYRCKAGKIQFDVDGGCCKQPAKPASSAKPIPSGEYGCCQQPSKIDSSVAGRGCCYQQPNKIASSVEGRGGCCRQSGKIDSSVEHHSQCCGQQQPLKVASQVNGGGKYTPPPCPTPAAAPTCGLDMPVGSVVGNLPFNTQADYAAGLVADGVIINAGTYWVTGIAKASDSAPFYRIIVACQYLYVPVDSMQPSFEAPWNGEALPTNEVS